jgi:hypothetical protein
MALSVGNVIFYLYICNQLDKNNVYEDEIKKIY